MSHLPDIVNVLKGLRISVFLSGMFFDKGLIGFDVAVVSSDRATGVAQTPKRGTQRHGNSLGAFAA